MVLLKKAVKMGELKHPFDYKARDKYYWEKLDDLKKMEDISLADVLQNWRELEKRITKVPCSL